MVSGWIGGASSIDLALATQRRLATREVRGVLGKKQRERITLTPSPVIRVVDAEGNPLGPKALSNGSPSQRRLLTSGKEDDDSTEP